MNIKEIEAFFAQKNQKYDLLKKVVKLIVLQQEEAFAPHIFALLQRDLQQPVKKWRAICLEIEALGRLNYQAALPIIAEICHKNEMDMITVLAASSFVRLSRANVNDITPILSLLKFGGYSIRIGAINVLGQDKVIPTLPEQILLIKECWDWNIDESMKRGLMDDRKGLIIACAGWDRAVTNDFLNHCILTGSSTLNSHFIQPALKGKYVMSGSQIF